MSIVPTEELLKVPDFHDGRILSLSLINGDGRIVISDLHGHRYALALKRIYRLRADNFREGNIILAVRIPSNNFVNDKNLLGMFDLDRPSDAPFFLELIGSLESKKKILLIITPSFGCELSVICENITVDRLIIDEGEGKI